MSYKLIVITIIFYVCAILPGVAQTFYTPAKDTLHLTRTDTILHCEHPIQPDQSNQSDTLLQLDQAQQSSVELHDIEIFARRRLPVLEQSSESGTFRIGASALKTMPSLMGTPDPIRLMQSLPAVSSSDCISGGIYVHGSENAHNLVRMDGVEIYNPMHLLGLFSVFNAPHFESFDIKLNPSAALSPNFVGAEISAHTSSTHPHRLSGEVTVGLIDSHGTLRIPISDKKSSVQISARKTYLNALFGDAIKVENAPLKYRFEDFNLGYPQKLWGDWQLKLSAYYGEDNMSVSDPNYSSDIRLGWKNLAIGTTLDNTDGQIHTIGISRFSNRVNFKFAGIDKLMPSDISSILYNGQLRVGAFNIALGIDYRQTNPQHSTGSSSSSSSSYSKLSSTSSQSSLLGSSRVSSSDTLFTRSSLESYLGIELPIAIKSNLCLLPGLKVAYYHAGDFNRLNALPSVALRWALRHDAFIEASVGRRVQFIHKIEESTIGFPTDFWIVADRRYRPLYVTDNALSFQGSMGEGKANYSIGLYYKSFSNLTDWVGNLFRMLETDYEPLSDVVSGDGRSFGLWTMLQGSLGPLKGWISYTLSKSQQKFNNISSKWYPYSHDRTHDLKLNLSWNIRHNLVLSGTFVYASGNPYTEPLYGYMIGENLILEFKEHNSSRLPSMHRLDLGLDWTFFSSRRVVQSLNLSVFNAYKHNNVMFKSFTYSPDKGIMPTQWSMGYILPSISYNLRF